MSYPQPPWGGYRAPVPPPPPPQRNAALPVVLGSVAMIVVGVVLAKIGEARHPHAESTPAAVVPTPALPTPALPPPAQPTQAAPGLDAMAALVNARGCPRGRFGPACDDVSMFFATLQMTEATPLDGGYRITLRAIGDADALGMQLALQVCTRVMVGNAARALGIEYLRIRSADDRAIAAGRPGRCRRADQGLSDVL